MRPRLRPFVLLALLLAWPVPGFAAITFLEAGTAATQGLQFYDASAFSPTSEGTIVPPGAVRSLKLPAYGQVQKNNVTQDAGTRFSAYIYLSALPNPTMAVIRFVDSVNGLIIGVAVKTDGKLSLKDGGSVFRDGTTALSAATWYRVSIAYTITSATVNEFRLYLDGVLEVTASNITTNGITGTPQLFLDNPQTGQNVYFGHIYVDDSSGLTDTGNIRVTAKLPASVNTGNFNVTVGTGAVNERPLSQTNGMQDTTINGDQQNYTLQTAAVGDVDLTGATIVGRSAWIWAKVTVASVLSKLMDNGSESAVTLTTTPALYTLLTASASYPSNAAGIGARSSTTADTFLYECGALIAFTPAAAASAVRHRAITQ